MEPNKFEKKIRNKLKGREIQPRPELWTRVESELKTSNHQSRQTIGRPKFWIGVAASIAILLSISYFLSNRPNTVDQNKIQEVVGTETLDKNEKEQEEETEIKQDLIKEAQKSIEEQPRSIETTILKIAEKQDPKINFDQPPTLIENNKSDIRVDAIQGLDESINSLIEKVNLLEKAQGSLTDREVDSLLRDAQKNLLKHKKIRPTKSIDAMALLDEVEYEIDATLKEKLFEALKKGFIEVRTAVAQRNQ